MNFVSTLPNWGWIVLGLVPLGIILLYFLKLRRQPMQVPSTFLWARTIEDLHVNSLLQRLRNNLLLFLQLLFVALAILSLLRPGWQGNSGPARRVVFLLDSSASMSARDMEENKSRFQYAKEQIKREIDSFRGDDEAMLIAFSDRADILQEFTTDQRRLRDAIDKAEVTSRSTNLREALRAAAGLANPNRTSQAGDVKDVQVADALPADLDIYSDGGFPSVSDFSLGNLTPTFHKIGTETATNLAITAFSAERVIDKPDLIQAFARIVNFGSSQLSATASLTVDGALIEAQRVELDGEEESGLSFEFTLAEATELKLTLEIEDSLPLDNVAYAALTPLRQISVLVITPGNQSLLLAMETEEAAKLARVEVKPPDYLQTDDYQKRALAGTDDLIVYDRCAPERMPPVNTMFIGAIPSEGWSAGELSSPILPIDIDRTHPIMRYLDLFSLRIVEGRSLQPPQGAMTLIEADIGPVLSLAPRGGFQDLVMGFDIVSAVEEGIAFNTDWPVQRSWPVFVYNALRFLGGALDTAGATSIRPGETIALRVDNRFRTVNLHPPQGTVEELQVGAAGSIPFADTDQPGVYEVKTPNDEQTVALFAVNLFDSRESNLKPVPEIELGYETVEGSVGQAPRRSDLWRWLLLAALGILMVEWTVFNRRLI